MTGFRWRKPLDGERNEEDNWFDSMEVSGRLWRTVFLWEKKNTGHFGVHRGDVEMEKKSIDNFSRTLPIERRSYREENRYGSGIERDFSFTMGYT